MSDKKRFELTVGKDPRSNSPKSNTGIFSEDDESNGNWKKKKRVQSKEDGESADLLV